MLVAWPLSSANAKWLDKSSPRMPYGVYIEGLQGSVVLAVRLDRSGHVTDTKILKTSGSPALDGLAQGAAMKWRMSADGVVPSDLTQGRVEKIVFVHAPPHGKELPPNTFPYWASR